MQVGAVKKAAQEEYCPYDGLLLAYALFNSQAAGGKRADSTHLPTPACCSACWAKHRHQQDVQCPARSPILLRGKFTVYNTVNDDKAVYIYF